jgi:hypothetical protein
MAIELTNLCQTLYALPGPGGLLDQDSYHIFMIQAVLAAQAEKAELDRKKDAARAQAQRPRR